MSTAIARALWKQRTCPACGCVYRGRISQPQTEAAVTKAYRSGKDLAGLLESVNSTAAHLPCPGCGTRPPFNVAVWRFGLHASVLALTLVAAIALGVLTANNTLAGKTFYTAAGGVAAGVCVLHMLAWAWNPNGNLRAGLRRGRRAEDDGQLQILEPPAHRPEPVRYPRWTAAAVLFVLISAAAPVSAYFLLGIDKPQKIAQTVQVRELVKAGATDVVASWDGGFKSVSGLYRTKQGKVTLTNAAALGVSPNVGHQLHQDSWTGTRIEDTGDTVARIQVTLAIPNDPKVKGKTLEFRAELTVEYPTRVSSDHFLEANATYTHDFKVRVATDEEVATVAKYNKAGFYVVAGNLVGLFAGLFAAVAAMGAWNPRDDGTPVTD